MECHGKLDTPPEQNRQSSSLHQTALDEENKLTESEVLTDIILNDYLNMNWIKA